MQCLESNTEKRIVGNIWRADRIYPGPPPSLVPRCNDDKEKWYTLSGFLQYYYIPFLTMPLTKVNIGNIMDALILNRIRRLKFGIDKKFKN